MTLEEKQVPVSTFVKSALTEHGFTEEMCETESNKLLDSGVLNVGVLMTLTEADWSRVGVTTGAARLIQEKVAEKTHQIKAQDLKKSVKIKREMSRSASNKRMKL